MPLWRFVSCMTFSAISLPVPIYNLNIEPNIKPAKECFICKNHSRMTGRAAILSDCNTAITSSEKSAFADGQDAFHRLDFARANHLPVNLRPQRPEYNTQVTMFHYICCFSWLKSADDQLAAYGGFQCLDTRPASGPSNDCARQYRPQDVWVISCPSDL